MTDYPLDDSDVLASWLYQESKGDPKAVSYAGARGLAQIMPATWDSIAPRTSDPFNPKDSYKAGKDYLDRLNEDFKDPRLALTAYNAGPGKVRGLMDKYGDSFEDIKPHLKEEQKKYADSIFARAGDYKEGKQTRNQLIDETIGAESDSAYEHYRKQRLENEKVAEQDAEKQATALEETEKEKLQKLAAEPAQDFSKYPDSTPGYAQALMDVINTPTFDQQPLADKVGAIGKAYRAKKWGDESYDVTKKIVTNYWNAANPEELPDLKSILGTPPKVPVGEDPEKSMAAWKEIVPQRLFRQGINPALFGDAFDEYLGKAAEKETAAANIRNRSNIEGLFLWPLETGRIVAEGALSVPARAVAGVARLAGQDSMADTIENSPESLLGKPSNDYIYNTNSEGYVQKDAEGMPETRVSYQAKEMLGAIGGMIVGGSALKGLGYATSTIFKGTVGVNALTGANDSFKLVMNKTGSREKAYAASAFAIPASIIGSLGEVAVISKLANPAMRYLPEFSKRAYLGQVIARNAAIEGTANLGFDLTMQAGETLQTGEGFNKSRAALALGTGAVAAGAISGFRERGATGRMRPPSPPEPPPPGWDRAAYEKEAEQYRTGRGPFYTDASGTTYTTPPIQFQTGLPGPHIYPGAAEGAAIAKASEEQIKKSVAGLQLFRDSMATSMTLPYNEAMTIPTDMYTGLKYTVADDIVTLTKETNYQPVDAEDLPGLDKHIEDLQKKLANSKSPQPGPDSAANLQDQYIIAKATRDQAVAMFSRPREFDYASRKQAFDKAAEEGTVYEVFGRGNELKDAAEPYNKARELQKTQFEFDQAKHTYEQETDPVLKSIARDTLKDAKGSHETSIRDLGENVPEAEVINIQTKRIELIEKQLAEVSRGELYRNDLTAAQKNLVELHAKRAALIKEAELKQKSATKETEVFAKNNKQAIADELGVPVNKPIDTARGIKVDNGYILPYKGKFYPMDAKGNVVSKGHDYYVDALSTLQSIVANVAKVKASITTSPTAAGVSASLAPGINASVAPGAAAQTIFPQERVAALTPIAGVSEQRLMERPARKTLTSNYSKPTPLTRTSPEQVTFREAHKSTGDFLKTFNKNLKIFLGGKMPKIKGHPALGFYDWQKNFAKVGRFGDVQTMLHEAIHATDAAFIGGHLKTGVPDYTHIPQNIREGIMDMADTFYGVDLPDDIQRMKEGLAVFYENYATSQPVRTDVENWYNNDFKRTHPEVHEGLEKLRELSIKYYSQTAEAYNLGRIQQRPTKAEELKAAAKGVSFEKAVYDWVDQEAAVKKIDKEVGSEIYDTIQWLKGKAKHDADFYVRKTLLDINGEPVSGLNLQTSIAPAKGQYDILESYLISNNAVSEYKKGRDPGGNRQDHEDFVDLIKSDPVKYAGVLKAADNVYKLLEHTRDVLASSSRAGQTIVDQWIKENIEKTQSTHGNYVPIARVGKGKVNTLKKRTGSTREVFGPIAEIRDGIENTLSQAYQLRVKETLIDAISAPGVSEIGQFGREVTGGERVGAIKTYDEQVKKAFDVNDVKDISATDYSLFASVSDAMPGISSSDLATIAYPDGHNIRVFEIDPSIANALATTYMPEVMNSLWYKAFFRLPAQILRPAATTLRGAFQVKNLIRDTLSLYRYVDSGDNNWKDLLNVSSTVAKQLVDAGLYHTGRRQDGWAAKTDQLGVFTSTRTGALNDARTELRKKYGDNFLDWTDAKLNTIENFFSIGEHAVRSASVRLEAKRLGITDPNAPLKPGQAIELALAGKRGSTNFQVQGARARLINLHVPFFSAHIAELSRLPGDYARDPSKFKAIAAAMFGLGIAHAWANSDETWYQEQTPEAKASAFIQKMTINGVDKIFMIPLDTLTQITFGLGSLIGSKLKEDPNLPLHYSEMAKAYMSEFSPVDAHSPMGAAAAFGGPLIKEAIQLQGNWDYYRNRRIIPPNLEYADPREQYNEFTSSFAKGLGDMIGQSPLHIDHFIANIAPAARDALGQVDILTGARSAQEYQGMNFVMRALTKAGTASGQMERSQSLFTERLLAFRQNKLRETPEEGLIRKQLGQINVNTSDINMMIYAAQGVKLDAASKETLDALKNKKRELLRLGIRIASGSPEKAGKSQEKNQADALRKAKKSAAEAEAKTKGSALGVFSLPE